MSGGSASGEEVGVFPILEQLAALGARLEVTGDALRCHVPTGTLPTSLATLVRERKPELIHFLRSQEESRRLPPPQPRTEPVSQGPASCAQARVWFHEQLRPSDPFYLMPLALRLRGPLNGAALENAWKLMVQRHPSLRTRIAAQPGGLVQIVEPSVESRMANRDWTADGCVADSGQLVRHLSAEAFQRFELEQAPLARAMLCVLGEHDHVLLIAMHHIISDGWSVGVLLDELLQTYRCQSGESANALPDLPIDYIDYAQWQAGFLASDAFVRGIAYWMSTLKDAPAPFSLCGVEVEAQAGQQRAGRVRLALPSDLRRHLEAWALDHGGTLYSVMLSGLHALLYLWSGQRDLVIGSVVAGRTHPGLERVIGCFMNTLPVRSIVDPEHGFVALHEQVQRSVLDAWEHQACPFEKIVEAVNPWRNGDANPIFNVAFLLQNYPLPSQAGHDLAIEVVPLAPGGGSLDLRWIAGDLNEDFTIACEFDSLKYTDEVVQSALSAYAKLLGAVLADHDRRLCELRRISDLQPLERTRLIAIVGTFTVDPVRESLEFWLRSLRLPYSLEIEGYGQVVQSLLDPKSALRETADVGGILIRLNDWISGDDVSLDSLQRNIDEFVAACHSYRETSLHPLTVWICPLTDRCRFTPQQLDIVSHAEQQLAVRLGGPLGIRVMSSADIAKPFSLGDVGDRYSDDLGHIPYAAPLYTAVGTLIARELAAAERPPLKAVVLDADNTLWHGVCGEDAVQSLQIDAPALALQKFFLNLRSQGVALCLCSKNIESDVRHVFENRPDMLLQWHHFSALRVNWQPKSLNLGEIASELNIGLDAIALVDDNPAECAEVEANCPAVLAVHLPEARDEIEAFLYGVWEFDVVVTSPEAALRFDTYAQNVDRERLQKGCVDLEAYLEALQVQVLVRPLREQDLRRASELTHRTNQFNVSTRRRSADDIRQLFDSGSMQTYVVEVTDRFGAYGLTGLVLASRLGVALVVDTFLLSCRVLGKRVEREVLRSLEEIAANEACERIEVPFVRTERNLPALQFLREMFTADTQGTADSIMFRREIEPVKA